VHFEQKLTQRPAHRKPTCHCRSNEALLSGRTTVGLSRITVTLLIGLLAAKTSIVRNDLTRLLENCIGLRRPAEVSPGTLLVATIVWVSASAEISHPPRSIPDEKRVSAHICVSLKSPWLWLAEGQFGALASDCHGLCDEFTFLSAEGHHLAFRGVGGKGEVSHGIGRSDFVVALDRDIGT
jgi:hypothetical protein